MNDRSSLNFVNQDLRNRSFRNQNLSGANFQNADLRGCDFTGANLLGANFVGAKLGQSRCQWMGLVSVGIVTALVMFHALSKLLFGALGQTPDDQGWAYFLLLLVLSGMGGGSIALHSLQASYSPLSRLLASISAATSGLMIGFFYAGTWSGQNPRVALTGGLILAVIATIVSFSVQRVTWIVTIGIAGALAAYGFMLLIGTVAMAALTTNHWLLGFACTLLAILYAHCTLKALLLTQHTIRQFPGTCFRRANLMQTSWDAGDGYPNQMG